MPEINFLLLIDVLGTASFAISGARMALQKQLDVFGVIIISFVTSIGGGTIRDVLMGNFPVNWMRNELIIAVILVACIGTMLVRGLHQKLSTTLFLFDSFGLGLFTIAGMSIALSAGYSPGMSIAMGTISACFGGVIRDVLLNQVPLIFHKEIYASACIAGGLLYYGLTQMNVSQHLAEIVSIITIVLIRVVAVRFNLSLPAIHQSSTPTST
ncbi:trimeric intracellular cation channel family protein [Phnomibacter sp. MR]|jgi:uncharacterized membrane protein YeiH|uniref:trimeric intracellular cation channel family protein n=1 Tax=Phnomibacter sp. MR TaxID=3042318 RepID=UPI003A80BC59|nr:trimeric intracellular cation channel family protein [Chitinophagaceae bacterium]